MGHGKIGIVADLRQGQGLVKNDTSQRSRSQRKHRSRGGPSKFALNNPFPFFSSPIPGENRQRIVLQLLFIQTSGVTRFYTRERITNKVADCCNADVVCGGNYGHLSGSKIFKRAFESSATLHLSREFLMQARNTYPSDGFKSL